MVEKENKKTAQERLLDEDYEDVVIFSNPSYDDALIGVTEDNRAVYDYDKMVEWLVNTDGITELDAIEWIEYNTIRSLPYTPDAPLIMHRL